VSVPERLARLEREAKVIASLQTGPLPERPRMTPPNDSSGAEPHADSAREVLAEIAAYYATRYRIYGDTARGMDWRNEASQRLRFEVLVRHLDLSSEPSLLDVGCGNGELLAYLRERGIAVHYLGIDVCADMVTACQRRFGPEAALLASTADLAPRSLGADYVVASGTFNVRHAAAWEAFVERALGEMYNACRIATVFNMTSTLADHRYDHLFYLDPARVPALAAGFDCRRFLLDHSYPLFDFTATLLR
jgi:SAM-dependent methyltransferase